MESNVYSVGKAVPFVIYSNKKFIVSDEAREILSDPQFNKLGIISLVGKYRTGKSFLLNRVLLNQKRETGFDVGPTIKPCTKGIWMWSKPVLIDNNHSKEKFHTFMIDTEGLGAYDEEINHDSKIFLIAVLISSLFIFNSFGNIDENSINSLSFILNLSKTIKISSDSNSNSTSAVEEISKYFPSLLWLLRDFSLKLEDTQGNTITAREYLENALTLQKGSTEVVEEKNKVRKMITTYFPERDCFSMVRPVENEKELQNLNNLDDDKIRVEFLEQAETLRNKVFKKVKPKTFNGKILTGGMLCELLNSILDSINTGGIPVIENSWKYVVHNECVKNLSDSVDKYRQAIYQFKNDNKENANFFSDLEEFTKDIQNKVVESFKSSLTSMGTDPETTTEFLEKLKGKLCEEFKKFNDENSKLFENKMSEALDKNAKKLVETFETDKYVKNYYQFFQDLESLKEISEASTPDFPMKKEIIFEKLLQVVKKFIEMNFLKNKINIEKEVARLKNELDLLGNKLKNKETELNEVKTENAREVEKLQNANSDYKTSIKSLEEKLKAVETEKKQLEEKNEKNLTQLKKESLTKIEKIKAEKDKLENEYKNKENENMKNKFTEEKMNALNGQKMEFMEKEIQREKERNETMKQEVLDYKKQNDDLHVEIDELKSENNKKKILEYEIERLKKENENFKAKNLTAMNINQGYLEQLSELGIVPDQGVNMQNFLLSPSNINNNSIRLHTFSSPIKDTINPLGKSPKENFISSIKQQIEDNKKLNEQVLSAVNEIANTKNEELIQTNKNLTEKISNYFDVKLQQMEGKINDLKAFKKMVKNFCTAFQCKSCLKFYTLELFQSHYKLCDPNITKTEKIQQPYFVKVKILKGLLNKDELGKPYIEYITDITYNNTQNWRVNKKFNQFANLHKTFKMLFPDFKFPESASIFSKINLNSITEKGLSSSIGNWNEMKSPQLSATAQGNNFHENKIKLLEKYLNDICEIDKLVRSKAFRKFFEFGENIFNLEEDEEINESMVKGGREVNVIGVTGSLSGNNLSKEETEIKINSSKKDLNFEEDVVNVTPGLNKEFTKDSTLPKDNSSKTASSNSLITQQVPKNKKTTSSIKPVKKVSLNDSQGNINVEGDKSSFSNSSKLSQNANNNVTKKIKKNSTLY
jgi:hypothetical protein